ncbi:MAG TPA: carbohydrate-binding protein [Gemmatimonadaceae bacterium]|nr:carbohydrate-binding protein [Gemmatimonadaceae bacterium]
MAPTGSPPPRPAVAAALDVAAPASISARVQVPASLRTGPFTVARYLTIPSGFTVSVLARVSGARFMAVLPNNDVLVSQPNAGRITLLRPNGTGTAAAYTFASGLRKPHDIVVHAIGSTTYIYVAESHQIARYVYTTGATAGAGRQVVVTGLPDASTPELGGSYGHQLKNIALDESDRLYVSVASSCNACASDAAANPVRGAIYQYSATGGGRRLFARGLRNAEGLAMIPGTNTLWAVVNNRDNIAYPFDDGSGQYGRVISSYVDNHPPEEFTRVRDGGNYGWPFCNPNPNTASGTVDMPFDRDYQLNRTGSRNCTTMDRISKGIQAHSAPLGLLFLQNTRFATAYRNGAVVALHGSWNRTTRTGAKVVYFPWNAASQRPGTQMDLVRGWLSGGSYWGRPVDVAVDRAGAMLISDDHSGTIYKLSAAPAAAASATYEGERARLVGARVGTDVAGYTGTGFVDYVNPTGDYAEWTVTAAAAGSHTLTFRYGLGGTAGRPLEIAVNGAQVAAHLAFPPTGSWSTWRTVSVTASLRAGTNTVRARATGSSGPNVDNLVVKPM